ncbi:uncharacterized protein LOC123711424 [Pieris brassicae]|uniref:Uncharacterized protein n=1 Tax=Pieris brassicae TaxID=7116 RepID=A0A9P0XE80_PIEBR|nr:uncharacterized protein LOC123711424 [Pieris brassicae]CAH4031540.1 unnamed protein product [Pieris brassicae]
MSVVNPASGDSEIPMTEEKNENLLISKVANGNTGDDKQSNEINGVEPIHEGSEIVSEHENLKERIKQCRNIIESLKLELNQEKARLEMESKIHPNLDEPKVTTDPIRSLEVTCPSDLYSTCVENKLTCDENLIQYEKQLQRYQNTLNMAQIEKKNAIRKHMIAKAYKLKLLEVENQCNIELLRVKQSLQCLEPLQMIANKWKTNTDEFNYDLDTFELMPRYPELHAVSGSDVSSVSDSENKNKSAITSD